MDLNEIKNAIEKSKFISIDLEFTGIGRTSTQFFDSMQDRYEQIRMSVVDHIVNQVGITCWTHDSLDDCWIPVTFSIYVKPNSGSYFTSSSK